MERHDGHNVSTAPEKAFSGDVDMADGGQLPADASGGTHEAKPDGVVEEGGKSSDVAGPWDGAALLCDPAKHIAFSSPGWLSEILLSQSVAPAFLGAAAGVDAVGNVIGSYNILRAFSWQLRLSPFSFDDYATALCVKRSTPLLDEVHMCLLRALYLDDTPEQRARRYPDPALLDVITWPEFLWQYLQSSGSKLAQLPFSIDLSSSAHSATEQGAANHTPQEKGVEGEQSVGPRALKALFVKTRKAQHNLGQVDYPSLPAASRAAILMELCDDVIATKAIRQEIDRRASKGFWVAGEGGTGGAFAMFTDEIKALKAHAEDNDAIDINQYNDDYCSLCGIGGGLLCCDGCPAAYHLRCIGETSKSVPEGEWLCPECAVGGRHEAAGLRVPPAGLNAEKQPVFVAHGRLWNAVPDATKAVRSHLKSGGEPDADKDGGKEAANKGGIGEEANECSSQEESEDTEQPHEEEEEQDEKLGRGQRHKTKPPLPTSSKTVSQKCSKSRKGQADMKSGAVKLRSATCDLAWANDQRMQICMLEGAPAVAAAEHIDARHSHSASAGFEVDPSQEEMIKGAVAETAGLSDSDYDPDDDLDELSEEDGEFSMEVPDDLHPTSLELLKKHVPTCGNPGSYVNRYRNGWVALNAAQKVVLEEAKQAKVMPETLPVPLMISKFVWSNRGRRVPGEGPPSAEQYVEDHSHVRTLAGYLMRLERDLWGLLEGPWAAPGAGGAAFRQDWLRRMRDATTPEQVKVAALEVISAVKWSAMHPQWRSAAKVRIADKVGEYQPPTVAEKPVPQIVAHSTITPVGGATRVAATPRVPRTAPSRVVPEEDDRDPSQIVLSKKRCGKCATCLKPHFKQKCQDPILRYADGHVEHMGVVIQEAPSVMPKIYKRRKPSSTFTDDARAAQGSVWLQRIAQPTGLPVSEQAASFDTSAERHAAPTPAEATPYTAEQEQQRDALGSSLSRGIQAIGTTPSSVLANSVPASAVECLHGDVAGSKEEMSVDLGSLPACSEPTRPTEQHGSAADYSAICGNSVVEKVHTNIAGKDGVVATESQPMLDQPKTPVVTGSESAAQPRQAGAAGGGTQAASQTNFNQQEQPPAADVNGSKTAVQPSQAEAAQGSIQAAHQPNLRQQKQPTDPVVKTVAQPRLSAATGSGTQTAPQLNLSQQEQPPTSAVNGSDTPAQSRQTVSAEGGPQSTLQANISQREHIPPTIVNGFETIAQPHQASAAGGRTQGAPWSMEDADESARSEPTAMPGQTVNAEGGAGLAPLPANDADQGARLDAKPLNGSGPAVTPSLAPPAELSAGPALEPMDTDTGAQAPSQPMQSIDSSAALSQAASAEVYPGGQANNSVPKANDEIQRLSPITDLSQGVFSNNQNGASAGTAEAARGTSEMMDVEPARTSDPVSDPPPEAMAASQIEKDSLAVEDESVGAVSTPLQVDGAQSLATPSQVVDAEGRHAHGLTDGMSYLTPSANLAHYGVHSAATSIHDPSESEVYPNGLLQVDGIEPPRLSPEPEDDPEAARRVREKNRVRVYRYNKALERLGLPPPGRHGPPDSVPSLKRKRGRPPKNKTPRAIFRRTPSTAPAAKRPRRPVEEPSVLRRSGRTPSFLRSESGSQVDGNAGENGAEGQMGDDDGESSEEDEDVAAALSDLILPSYGRRGRRGAGGYAWRDSKPPATAGWMVHRNVLDRSSGRFALPVAVAKSVARRGGLAPVSGVIYRRVWKGRVLDRAPAYTWISALESASTVSQIALVLREFDSYILWHDIKRPNPDKESTHPLRDLVVSGKREAEKGEGNEYQIMVPLPIAELPKAVATQAPAANPFEAALAAALPPGTSPHVMNTLMAAFSATQGDPAAALQAARVALSSESAQPGQMIPVSSSLSNVATPLAISQPSAPQSAPLPPVATTIPVQQLPTVHPVSGGLPLPPATTAAFASEAAPPLLSQSGSGPTAAAEAPAAAAQAAALTPPGQVLAQSVLKSKPETVASSLSTPAGPPLPSSSVEAGDAELRKTTGTVAEATKTEPTAVPFTPVPQAPTESTPAMGNGGAGAEGGNKQAAETPPVQKQMLSFTCGTASFKIPFGEPTWVHEKRLPLWVVRSYEEGVRRKELTALHRRTRTTQAESREGAVVEDDTDVCSKCRRAWDETEFDVLWIGCDRCKKWFHGDCVGMSFDKVEELGEDERWDCPDCVALKSAAAAKARERRLAMKAARAAENGSPSQKSRVTAKPSGTAAEEPTKVVEAVKEPKRVENVVPKEVVEDPPPAGELYCICQAPEDGRPYVGCDGCDGWFHPECMGTTLEEVEELDTFLCVLCARKAARRRKKRAAKMPSVKEEQPTAIGKSTGGPAKSEPASASTAAAAPVKATDAIRSKWGEEVGATGRKRTAQDWSVLGGGHRKAVAAAAAEKEKEKEKEKNAPEPLSEQDIKKQIGCAMAVITAIIKLKGAGPFRKPVPSDVPFYFDVIKHPMDLGTVYKQIKAGHYRSAFQVLKDVRLVWANCRAYNQPDSAICAAADRLENCVEELWAKWALPTEEHPDIVRALRKEREAAKREAEREAKREKEEQRHREAEKEARKKAKAAAKASAAVQQTEPVAQPRDAMLCTRRSARAAGIPPETTPVEAMAGRRRDEADTATEVADSATKREPRRGGRKSATGVDGAEVKQEAEVPRSVKPRSKAAAAADSPAAPIVDEATPKGKSSSHQETPSEDIGVKEELPTELPKRKTRRRQEVEPEPAMPTPKPNASSQPGGGETRSARKGKAEKTEKSATVESLTGTDLASESMLFTNTGRPLRRARIEEVMHDSPVQQQPSAVTPSPAVEVGASVEADWDNQGEYYPGKITLIHRSGAVSILYEDGDTETKVPMSRVRLLPDSQPTGDKVTEGSKRGDKQRSSPGTAPSRPKRSRR